MVPVRCFELQIEGKPILWNLKMISSYVLISGLDTCRLKTWLVNNESLREIFGFEISDNAEVLELLAFCMFHDIDVNIKTTDCETWKKFTNIR